VSTLESAYNNNVLSHYTLTNILTRNERTFISSKFICVLETGIPHCKPTIRAKHFASRGVALSLYGCNEARHFFASIS